MLGLMKVKEKRNELFSFIVTNSTTRMAFYTVQPSTKAQQSTKAYFDILDNIYIRGVMVHVFVFWGTEQSVQSSHTEHIE